MLESFSNFEVPPRTGASGGVEYCVASPKQASRELGDLLCGDAPAKIVIPAVRRAVARHIPNDERPLTERRVRSMIAGEASLRGHEAVALWAALRQERRRVSRTAFAHAANRIKRELAVRGAPLNSVQSEVLSGFLEAAE
ncbi:hypothetical protein [Hoeflea sp.]|uniref:hypothetical protein n=1 Tax=Hoeflea sp. TaxID=1940281 RepID=UPI003B522390